MSHDPAEYVACLPEPFRSRATVSAESTWWIWRNNRLHIARARNPHAPVRLMVLHGAGGHSGALWPAAALAAEIGYEVLAPDMPGYGRTHSINPAGIRYSDWVDCVCDLIREERKTDTRPLVLVGASMGGMLAYSAAASVQGVSAIVATCLLDPRDDKVWSALSPWLGRWSLKLMNLLAPVTDSIRLPIRWLAPMKKIANDPVLSRLCCTDPRGGGGRVPLGFLRSYLASSPTCEPEEFREIPLVLAHPGADRWTAPELSLRFYERIAAPKRYACLENAGHFPVEQPGIDQFYAVLEDIFSELSASRKVSEQM